MLKKAFSVNKFIYLAILWNRLEPLLLSPMKCPLMYLYLIYYQLNKDVFSDHLSDALSLGDFHLCRKKLMDIANTFQLNQVIDNQDKNNKVFKNLFGFNFHK